MVTCRAIPQNGALDYTTATICKLICDAASEPQVWT